MKKFLLWFYTAFLGIRNYVFRDWIMYIPFYTVRHFFIRCTVKHFGKGSSCLMQADFRNGKNISIGEHVVINSKVLLDGRGGKILIGNNVDIAQETNIWTLEHDIHSDVHTTSGGDVIIEDHVWIASRVTILPGVKIGKGAVIAACSVVNKNVEAMTVVAGVPAREIGRRNSQLNYTLHYRPWFR